jgi:glycosyltransferase involved in cell wall biosynthesis
LRASPRLWFLVPGFILAMFVACLRAAPKHDILHANWTAVGAIAGVAGYVRRTPVVTTLRGEDVNRLESSWLDRLLLQIALRTNKQLIAVSEAIRDRIVALAPGRESKVKMIPNGVDDELFSLEQAPYWAEHDPLQTVTIGSLIPRKSVATIVDALAQLHDVPVQLDIIGDGAERPSLQASITQLELDDRVRLQGAVPPSSIQEVLARSEVFVMASHAEGRPNALLEAMAAGLAVVVPAIPGIIELIDHDRTGLLYQPGEVSELAACLRRLAGDRTAVRRLGSAARRELDERGLRWHRTADQYLATYRAAVGEA